MTSDSSFKQAPPPTMPYFRGWYDLPTHFSHNLEIIPNSLFLSHVCWSPVLPDSTTFTTCRLLPLFTQILLFAFAHLGSFGCLSTGPFYFFETNSRRVLIYYEYLSRLESFIS